MSPISWQQLAFWSQVGVSTAGSSRLPASLSLLFSSPSHNGTGESEGPETFQIAPDPGGYYFRLAVAMTNYVEQGCHRDVRERHNYAAGSRRCDGVLLRRPREAWAASAWVQGFGDNSRMNGVWPRRGASTIAGQW